MKQQGLVTLRAAETSQLGHIAKRVITVREQQEIYCVICDSS